MDSLPCGRGLMRRVVLGAGLGMASAGVAAGPAAADSQALSDADREVVRRLAGGVPGESPRVRLEMPTSFRNGYSVPLAVSVDSPMTEADHVRLVRILAPRNPIIVTALFHFGSSSGRAAVSTRVRLSQPQNVIAVAEMSDGALLMARAWVTVETDGCA